MSRVVRKVVALSVLAIAIPAGLWVLYKFPDESPKHLEQSALFVASEPRSPSGLTIYSWTDKGTMQRDSTLRIWFVFRNSSDYSIDDLRAIEVQTPGFFYDDDLKQHIPRKIGPKETQTIGPYTLRPSTSAGVFALSFVLAWSEQKNESRRLVRLEPVRIADPERERLLLMGRRVASLFKDLTLPIVLVCLAYLFQRQQGKRDERFKVARAEEDRRQQVWNSILPRFHDLAEQHYLPIVRSIRTLVSQYDKVIASQDTETERQFTYHMLLLLCKMRHLRDEKGQIFFKDRKAERIVSLAWTVFLERAEKEFKLEKKDEAVALLDPNGTYADFCSVFQGGGVLAEIQKALATWVKNPSGDFRAHLSLLEIMQETTFFEANRPFDRHWYGVPIEDEIRCSTKYTLPLEPKDKITAIQRVLDGYVQEVGEYRASASSWTA